MAFYQYRKEQLIKASLGEVWDFISSPANLKKITPDYMGFDIITEDLPEKMYPGMIISYIVKPVFGIETNWVTEITYVKDHRYFVDEQRVGPYSMWHHEHILDETDQGILMKDIVSYQPPMGFLGAIANSLMIRRKLDEIFDYRWDAIEKYFHQQVPA